MAHQPAEVRPLWDGWWDRAESIAGHCAKNPISGAWYGFPERKLAALDGILEVLHELDGWPADVEILFRAARAAVAMAAYNARRDIRHGIYWVAPTGAEDPIAEAVTDKIGVRQLVWSLSDDHWAVIWATAEVMKRDGSQEEAAALAGLPIAVFKDRLRRARKKCRPLWIAPGETPPARNFSTIGSDGKRSKIGAYRIRHGKAAKDAA